MIKTEQFWAWRAIDGEDHLSPPEVRTSTDGPKTSPKHQMEHPYSTNNHIRNNSSSFQDQNPWQRGETWQNKLISRPLIQSMMKRVREPNSKYYLLTNEQTQIVSEPARALREQPQGESAEAPLQASRFNPIYVEPGSIHINSTRDLQTLYPNSFDHIGNMSGEYDIKTDPSMYHQYNMEDTRCQSSTKRRSKKSWMRWSTKVS